MDRKGWKNGWNGPSDDADDCLISGKPVRVRFARRRRRKRKHGKELDERRNYGVEGELS
jgi:hypothetical protein